MNLRLDTSHTRGDNQFEQLRLQKAAVARDSERKDEIDRMRTEEERLDKAIVELETRRY
jgi:hypothetical protein